MENFYENWMRTHRDDQNANSVHGPEDATFNGMRGNYASFSVGSGNYVFHSTVT
jgi:hypothetical protein